MKYFGFKIANASDEPAWFHTAEAAQRFADACGWKNANIDETFEVETHDLMDTPETPWTKN